MISLIEFSKGIREIINGHPKEYAKTLVNSLKMGKHNGNFEFTLDGLVIRFDTPIKDLKSVFEILNKVESQDNYELSIRGIIDGESKTISKIGSNSIDFDELRKFLLLGKNVNQIYYEIINARDFEIRKSEFENIIIKCKNKDLARKFFTMLTGLFPFADVTRDTKQVKIQCEIEIKPSREGETKQVLAKCKMTVDGEAQGIRSNIVEI